MITQQNKSILIKRLKSLSWRVSMMVGALLLDFILVNMGLFNLPIWAIGILGLVLGEITKYLNTAKE